MFKTNVHPPVLAGAVQLLTPSVTVTFPDGSWPPAGLAETLKLIAMLEPMPDGFGECPVIVVVVP